MLGREPQHKDRANLAILAMAPFSAQYEFAVLPQGLEAAFAVIVQPQGSVQLPDSIVSAVVTNCLRTECPFSVHRPRSGTEMPDRLRTKSTIVNDRDYREFVC